MSRPQLLWFMWSKTYVRVDHTNPIGLLWHGHDILEVLAIDIPGTAYDEPHYIPGWSDVDGHLVPFITTDRVRDLGRGNGAFLAFVQDVEAGTQRLAQRASGSTRRHLVAVEDAPELHAEQSDILTVAQAAAVLSRDPVIDLGRRSLFATLRDLAWITTTSNGAWIPTDEAIDNLLLVHNRRWMPNSRIDFNQIRVTHSGLRHLHSTLGGVAEIDFTAAPPLALVELT